MVMLINSPDKLWLMISYKRGENVAFKSVTLWRKLWE